ncbi:OmpA family protein [Luteimonas granuli]|uniref:OmpA family protein n=1 Tax=Luteimonas granuli TaxID=1176533 RepID=A0A518N4B7_9GAMM|nr:OmpA family protein [Luteimonas granuli]QDW66763.1 OmpA family protein [Luteimonas granuli]
MRRANRAIVGALVLASVACGGTGPQDGQDIVSGERAFTITARWREAFPHLVPPTGYEAGSRPRGRDLDTYPFWTGNGFEDVEGRTYAAHVKAAGNAHSMHEVRRNIEAMMDEAGGTKVFEGRIPEEAGQRHAGELDGFYGEATGFGRDAYHSLVYRADLPGGREVWVHARLGDLDAGWVVAERERPVAAAPLPAAALKRRLDADGRVAIRIRFAVDRADLLAASQPQIDQVLALLRDEPSLRLSIESHTDATGDAARDERLSGARARSVVAALTAQGIDAARLEAKGHGHAQPVADNDTGEGRAKNRRVELVRLD